jgi:hypothetical protein
MNGPLFLVARAVRASLHPFLFVRMAHATRGGRCKVCTNVMGFDLGVQVNDLLTRMIH